MADEPAGANPQTPPAAATPAPPSPPAADPTQIRMVKEFKHDRPLYGCRIDPTGRFAFSGGQDNLVMRWELASDAKVALAGHQSWVRGMAFQPAGELLATGDYAGRLNAWRYAAGV